MRVFYIIPLFFLTIALSEGVNNTSADLPNDEDDDDGLEELELQLSQGAEHEEIERRSGIRGGFWSPWSTWSPCSRSCDGGVAFQLRTCHSRSGCQGVAIRYKICNMQNCPDPGDFREEQCSTYNTIPYHDTYLKWSAHHDPHEPCALTCRGQPIREWRARTEEVDDEALIVVQLAAKVHDGTRCRPGSLDMCIEGKCQRVGCDLRIGSTRRVDECGVCGGDGSSCVQPLYHWYQAPASLCSATCGGGYKMSRPVCKNRMTEIEVEEFLCNVAQRPPPKIVECNSHPCPARWQTDEWGPCSVSCGGGIRLRDVHCSEQVNSSSLKVPEHRCIGAKPPHEEPCSVGSCPKWRASDWSECSVTCGEGIQTRRINCVEGNDMSSNRCEGLDKPIAVQPCHVDNACPLSNFPYQTGDGWSHFPESEGDYRQPLLHPYPPLLPDSSLHSGPFAAVAEKLVGEEQEPTNPSQATFIAEEWGPCNVTCGEGVRRREVSCKIFLEFSRAIARLPDEKCTGPKPTTQERCIRNPCSMDNKMDLVGDVPFSDQNQNSYGIAQAHTNVQPTNKTGFSWKENGFNHCTASCLGGTQELMVICVRDRDKKTVAPMLCSPATKPEIIVRSCNDFPCPPRWNTSEFQPCTKPCGMGIQLREVNCIHEVTRGADNTIVVPNSMCPSPPPPDRQYCNVLDCPVHWHAGNWSKCSKPCSGGWKHRNVTCQQTMAQDRVMNRPESMCSDMRPPAKKPCNVKPCMDTDVPTIASDPNQAYMQNNPQKKRVTLKVGGTAQVYIGTQVKLKCPVKRYERSKIRWEKDHVLIERKTPRLRVSQKGALKINKMSYQDNGLYTCVAGKSTADIVLSARPLPGYFPTSEEIHQAQNQVDNPAYHENSPDLGDMGQHKPFHMSNSEDISHEFKLDGVIIPPTPTKKTREDTRRHFPKTTVEPKFTSYTHKPPDRVDEDRSVRHSQTPSEFPSTSVSSSSSSGASRTMPHFQQLLANLQTFAGSRGHRALTGDPLTQHMSDNPFLPLLGSKTGDSSDEDDIGMPIDLGKGNPKNLKFEWILTPWTRCSESCGGNGFQMRSAHCMVRLHNTTQYVRDNLCEDDGLGTPSTVQKCGADCPHWTHGEWSSCEDSRCFTWNTAMQRRDVNCVYSNGSEAVDQAGCPADEKPTQRQECYNDKCKGTWKVGEWSQCAAECEEEGIKYRILQCVWYGTKKPAGNACRDQPRPSVMKVCKGAPCSQSTECKDHSKFCHSVLTRNMCKVYRFQTQCCHTCRGRLLNLSLSTGH